MVRWRTICPALARPAARIAFLAAVAGCLCAQGQSVAERSKSDQDGNWVATWGCAPGFAIGQKLADQTIRQFARISVGGNRVRIRLSNKTGTQPLVIGAARLAVNQWIRTSKSFDGVIDFDSIIRGPAHPRQIRAEYIAGDHVHPNDAGYRVLADSIDLKLFSEP